MLCALEASANPTLWPTMYEMPTTYTILHNFAGTPLDGCAPYSSLTLYVRPSKVPDVPVSKPYIMYGTTSSGSRVLDDNSGTLFSIKPDGSCYTNLHNLAYACGVNSHMAAPLATNGVLYITAAYGGSCRLNVPSEGAMYVCDMQGRGFCALHTFLSPNPDPVDGQSPLCELIEVDNHLYGTTSYGGETSTSCGTVFDCDLRDPYDYYQIFHNFDSANTNDGYWLPAGLTKGNTFPFGAGGLPLTRIFGVTSYGGTNNFGTIFQYEVGGLQADTNSFETIYTFNGLRDPEAALFYDGTNLYGTTCGSTPSVDWIGYPGGIYSINPDSMVFTQLCTTAWTSAHLGPVIKVGDTLYGAVGNAGGPYDQYRYGYVYSLQGTNFTILHNFTNGPSDGSNPHCGLTWITNNSIYMQRTALPNLVCEIRRYSSMLYGTTVEGGTFGYGTIFALPISSRSETNLIQLFPLVCLEGNILYNTFSNRANASFTIDTSSIGPVGEVDYYAGSDYIGTITNYPYSFTWTNASLGSNAITVVISDTNGNVTAAGLTEITVIDDCVNPSGIAAWWPAEGNAVDIINGNNGILEGGLDFAPGEVGQAFNFTNADEDVVVPASSSLDVGAGSGFTLEAWVNCSDVASLNPLFEWNVGDGTTYWGVHFYVGAAGSGSLYANIVDNGGGWHSFSSAQDVVATNMFQHVALTYDETTGTATMYCNGLVVAQENLGCFTPLTTYNLYLGRRPLTQGETYTLSGLLDEPSVYNRALSASEIQAIYNVGSAGKCN